MTTDSESDRDRRRAGPPGEPGCAAADLFGALWLALVDAIGPTATATLLQRSLKAAASAGADVDGVVIRREQFSYTYKLPAGWHSDGTMPIESLRRIGQSLVPLLVELTGVVVVRRLAEVPGLARCGVLGNGSWR
jgi:hypothetical protein